MTYQKYSFVKILQNALTRDKYWQKAWNSPKPNKKYDVIIVGGGGHGLATAYYLAKNHAINNVAVLEKGWIGSGNVGRNTTIIRSNYMIRGNTQFYEWSLKLWEGLSKEINFNAMVSHRGIINLVHSPAQKEDFARRYNIMRLNGIDGNFLTREQLKEKIPHLDYAKNARFPIVGAFCQPRAGTVRHDAVAWGYARAASKYGVHIIQNCEVEGFHFDKKGNVKSVTTNQGTISANKIGIAVAGNSSRLMQMAGLNVPIESHLLQAFVSEPIKPLIHHVITFGAGHFYVSQSDKGGIVFGGSLDGYNSYAQRGNMPIVEEVFAEAIAVMPCLSRLKMQRSWGGIMDMSMDGSPFICQTPIKNLFFNGGWCYGGFKATPASGWCFASTIANEAPHQYNQEFTLNRFEKGIHIDEKGVGANPALH